MESAFKFVFGLAIFVFCLVVVGIFLILVKVYLMFNPEFEFMGIVFSLPFL